ncbi:hypothetical protein [Micromonospora ureilytica]|uniref:hypothetical protein n=1 Tax=Micromonospora ureilytica TaxID=709868 RepID=UPI002E10F648|nr:hypothetical protein OHB55_12975 [Micromonospora ureilytica]
MPGPLDGDGLPVVAADEVEAHVETGGESGAGALSAGLDLGLWLTERELGAATADRVAASIEYRTARR